MNLWKQRRLFVCTGCGEKLLHDAMYLHSLFTCPQRPRTPKQILEHFLLTGRTYCPTPERTQ
ncbi:MAG: hypothetical protein E8D52_06005 [Nitrospira sp.]|nr:MAG: hypothetical protein E8D52_06005 [Nitrospira sp.]